MHVHMCLHLPPETFGVRPEQGWSKLQTVYWGKKAMRRDFPKPLEPATVHIEVFDDLCRNF